MMPEINGAMLSLSSSPVALAVAKVTITTALGLVCARLARRSRAAVRHALLAVAFGVLLALPVASVIAPPVGIAVRLAAPARTVAAPLTRASGAMVALTPADPGASSAPALSRANSRSISRSWRPSSSTWLLMGWIAGALLFLLPMAMGLRRVHSLRGSGVAWPQGQSAAEALARDAGIRRRFEVLLHEAVPGPMTCGVVRTAIVLPPDARDWDTEDLNRAMVHELEHVQRRDWISQCVARAICAVYWFHPLVWLAWRQLTVEAERACDDAVLGRSEATAYADQLVGLAQRLSLISKRPVAKSPLLAMANHADLATRVGAVLDNRQRRGRAGVLPVALACAAAAVLVVTMSPLRMVAAPQAADTDVRTTTVRPLALSTAAVGERKSRLRIVAAPQAADTTVKVTSTARFSSTTNLVLVNVVVTDQNGATIEGLSPQDFTVTEDSFGELISVFEFVKPAGTTPGAPNSQPSYYTLGYYTWNGEQEGKFRMIKVGVRQANATLSNVRPGYYENRAPGAVASPGVVNDDTAVDPSLRLPVPIRKNDAVYSEEARKAKWQGTSFLSVEVDASGRVTNVDVIRKLGLGLDEKAVEAVKQWQFKPGTKDGKPVAVQVQVDMSFRLL